MNYKLFVLHFDKKNGLKGNYFHENKKFFFFAWPTMHN